MFKDLVNSLLPKHVMLLSISVLEEINVNTTGGAQLLPVPVSVSGIAIRLGLPGGGMGLCQGQMRAAVRYRLCAALAILSCGIRLSSQLRLEYQK